MIENLENNEKQQTEIFGAENVNLEAEAKRLKREINSRDIYEICKEFVDKKDIEGLYRFGKSLEDSGRHEDAAKVFSKASKLSS